MELYAGLDLHSRNTYIGILNKGFKRVYRFEMMFLTLKGLGIK